MRAGGSVKFFNAEKGYGFIKRDDGGRDLFVHVTYLRKTGLESLERDAKVTFEVEDNAKGERAISVELA